MPSKMKNFLSSMKVKNSAKSPLDALEFRIHKMHNINTQAMDIQRPKEFKVEVKLISCYQ